jgi:hypothetical protein
MLRLKKSDFPVLVVVVADYATGRFKTYQINPAGGNPNGRGGGPAGPGIVDDIVLP